MVKRALSLVLLIAPVAYAQDVVTEDWSDATPQPRSAGLLQAQILRDHNDVRASYGVPPLVWDDTLAADANAYARTLATTRQFQHAARLTGQPVEGENLWMGTRSAYSYRDMTGSWIEEGAAYRPGRFPEISATGSWHDVGHFTQMIWSGTRAVGCASAANEQNEYLVCRYYPAGNVWGQQVVDR